MASDDAANLEAVVQRLKTEAEERENPTTKCERCGADLGDPNSGLRSDCNHEPRPVVTQKCERCGAEYEYVKGVYSPGWCQRCGHGSPAELEQRERATKLQWAVEYTLKMMEGLPLTSAEQLQNWLSRARAWARATNPEMRKR